MRHLHRESAAKWKEADPVGGREVFEMPLGEGTLIVGQKDAALIYLKAPEGVGEWSLSHEIPLSGGGARMKRAVDWDKVEEGLAPCYRVSEGRPNWPPAVLVRMLIIEQHGDL